MKVGIIGAGAMGSAIAKGLKNKHKLVFYDRSYSKAAKAADECEGRAVKDLKELLKSCSWVILAVKPFDFENLASEIKSSMEKDCTICSVMTGITLSELKENFPDQTVFRTMPNIAVSDGLGTIGIAEDNLNEKEKSVFKELFSDLGLLVWLSETKMDALTSLAGSGPAFSLVMIESMIEAGIVMGFSASEATKIVTQMLKGTLALLENDSSQHPGSIKWKITSPQGTTIAGIKALEKANVRYGIMETFLAAYQRSKELAE